MYAVLEGFVDTVLREYLGFLNTTYSYVELSESFRSNYVRGVGLIVAESSKQRYKHLPVHSLASDLATALAGATSYRLTPEAMLIQEQNLRLAELERIFGHCGLSGLRTWIEHHHEIRAFFSSAARISGTPEAELREIVSYRNEAAHGEVDNVLGVAVLTEFTEFILSLCIAIAEFIQNDMLARLAKKSEALEAGVVTETFRGNIMVAVLRDASVAVGDIIYLAAQYRCTEAKVLSLQLEDRDVASVEAQDATEVGVKLDVIPKRRSRVLIPLHSGHALRFVEPPQEVTTSTN